MFNNRPIVRRDRFAVSMGNTVELSAAVLMNDFDPENTPLQVLSNGAATLGNAWTTNNGQLFYTPTNPAGVDSFTYTAVDKDGGTATTNVLITILPATLWPDFPQIAELSFPTNDTPITAPIEVIGTVDSPYLRSYRLEYRPHRSPLQPWVTFVEGDVCLANANLGTFDPTRLPNGAYQMRLLVEDWVDGATAQSPILVVHVGEALKVGHFTVAFTPGSLSVMDATVPAMSVSILVSGTKSAKRISCALCGVRRIAAACR